MSDISQRLAAEEPAIPEEATTPRGHEDTQPRLPIKPPRDDDGWQRYLGGMILIAALFLSLAAGLLIFWEPNNSDISKEPTPVDDFTPFVYQATPTPTSPFVLPTPDDTSRIAVLPTAALDEQAIALLTPAVDTNAVLGAVERPNLPITVGNAESLDRGIVQHTIGQGDTWAKIAGAYSLDLCSVVWANTEKKSGPLKSGDILIIPPIDGVYTSLAAAITINDLAKQTKVDPFAIIDSPYNPDLFNATPETLLPEGIRVMIPGGESIDCSVWEPSPVIAGGVGADGVAVQTGGLWGCQTEIHTSGGPYGHPIPSGNYTYFRGFSPGHPAVDLAGDEGTPIAAAGSGTVVFAGWNSTGYGYAVVIGHGSHYTLYAHMMSQPSVRCGQDVSQGQTIGFLGNTGNSTGPHLHYEIRNAGFIALDPCYTIRC